MREGMFIVQPVIDSFAQYFETPLSSKGKYMASQLSNGVPKDRYPGLVLLAKDGAEYVYRRAYRSVAG